MSITLEGIALPGDLEWQDEFGWQPVRQATEYTLGGALIVEESAIQAGRPITLYGGEQYAWVTRSTVEALYTLAGTAAQTMTLDYHGESYTVMWRRNDKPIEAQPVMRTSNPDGSTYYYITLRLLEV